MAAPIPFFQGTFVAGDPVQYDHWLNTKSPRLTNASFAWLSATDGQLHASLFPIGFQALIALKGGNLGGSVYQTYPQGLRAYVFPDTSFIGAFQGSTVLAIPNFASLLQQTGGSILGTFIVGMDPTGSAGAARSGQGTGGLQTWQAIYIPGGKLAQAFLQYQATPVKDNSTGLDVLAGVIGAIAGIATLGVGAGLAVAAASQVLKATVPAAAPAVGIVTGAATGNYLGAVQAAAATGAGLYVQSQQQGSAANQTAAVQPAASVATVTPAQQAAVAAAQSTGPISWLDSFIVKIKDAFLGVGPHTV